MNFSTITLLHTLFFLVAGCSGPSRLTVIHLKQAAYQIPGLGAVTFTDGSYYPEPSDAASRGIKRIGLVDLAAFGDLNDDAIDDAVTFVARYGHNSEIYLSLEVFLNENGSPLHTASYLLGDRVAIDHVEITDGLIKLNIIVQGPGDAICCPTLHVSKVLRLHDGELEEINPLSQ